MKFRLYGHYAEGAVKLDRYPPEYEYEIATLEEFIELVRRLDGLIVYANDGGTPEIQSLDDHRADEYND